MSEFRTIVSSPPSQMKIGLKDRILTLGSCFSDAIGARLGRHKFHVSSNPFGVIYNPISIHEVANLAITNHSPDDETYVRHNDIYLNYSFHSALSSMSKPELENQIRMSIAETNTFLSSCNYVLITYGTSWIYSLYESGKVVANCHKQPSRLFRKTLLNIEDITISFEQLNNYLLKLNPDIRVILTVSPVRHLKDTLELNSVSKSILRTACYLIAEKFAHVEYFPAYEIMIDDLRDYRFYKSDMIHPNEQAEDYIWNKFIEKYMHPATAEFIREWKKINASLSHRAFHPSSAGHQIFLHDMLKKLTEFKDLVDVTSEINFVQTQLLDSLNSNTTDNDH